jgi:hypothetical protein
MRGMTLCCLAAGLLLASALLLASGCSKAGPTVTGTVLVDGKPLEKGSITFVPIDDKAEVASGRGPGGGGTIKRGKYQVDKGLTPGKYRVEIQGTRKGSGKIPNPLAPGDQVHEEVAVVPPEYNKKSILIREILPGSNPPIDFDLEGIKKRH